MENSIYIALSRQMTLRNNMNIIANNLANMNTPGFRGQNLVFEEFISDPKGQKDPLSFVYDYGQYHATDPGPLQQTKNPFDIALVGPGFIGVESNGDTPAYTRAGNFQMRPDGTLVTSTGFPVQNANGGQIVIPAGAGEVKIDQKGRVSTQDGQIGQIKIVEFENLQDMEPMGTNLYVTDAEAVPAANTTVKQGYVEGSNVKPIVEMTRMIDTMRSNQGVQSLLQSENERLRTAIRKLTSQS